jgi:hypothetical protein
MTSATPITHTARFRERSSVPSRPLALPQFRERWNDAIGAGRYGADEAGGVAGRRNVLFGTVGHAGNQPIATFRDRLDEA